MLFIRLAELREVELGNQQENVSFCELCFMGTLDSAGNGSARNIERLPSLEKNGIVFPYLWVCIHTYLFFALFQKKFKLKKKK